jgi:hypothetical protein
MSKVIERKLRNALTVAQLIKQLQSEPPDAVVLFTCDYGDITHTRQALPVKRVDEIDSCEFIEESAYSQSGLALQDGDEDEPDIGPTEETFVILS